MKEMEKQASLPFWRSSQRFT